MQNPYAVTLVLKLKTTTTSHGKE